MYGISCCIKFANKGFNCLGGSIKLELQSTNKFFHKRICFGVIGSHWN